MPFAAFLCDNFDWFTLTSEHNKNRKGNQSNLEKIATAPKLDNNDSDEPMRASWPSYAKLCQVCNKLERLAASPSVWIYLPGQRVVITFAVSTVVKLCCFAVVSYVSWRFFTVTGL